MSVPNLPALPVDDEGPVFREPWEAQAFALVVKLHEGGHFGWDEWAQTLGAEIKAAQAAGDPDLGTTYYRHWLAALERLVAAKGILSPEALADRRAHLAAHPPHQDHVARREPVKVA